MPEQISVEIVQGSKQLTEFTADIYQLIEKESRRGNMLAKNISDIELEIISGKSSLAFLEKKFAGYIAIFPWPNLQLVEICSFVVKEECRRKGIGTKLVKQAFKLAKKLYPKSQVIALANQNSRNIFDKQGLTYLPKCCLPRALWDVCPQCKEYHKLPACHCWGMIEKQRNQRYRLYPLTPQSEYVVGTTKTYCEIWKEAPWNEDFWTVERVTADIRQELSKQNASGCILLNQTNVVSFSWGYEVNRDTLAEISGNSKLDILFSDGKRIFYIDELGTLLNYRQENLGKEISWQLLSVAEKKGFDSVVLRTNTKATAARILYQKLGFKELSVFDEQHKDRNYWMLNLKPNLR